MRDELRLVDIFRGGDVDSPAIEREERNRVDLRNASDLVEVRIGIWCVGRDLAARRGEPEDALLVDYGIVDSLQGDVGDEQGVEDGGHVLEPGAQYGGSGEYDNAVAGHGR